MYLCPFYPLNQINANRIFILDFKQGDVNGDLIIDNVYLIEEKPYGIKSPFVDNITILIQDGRTNIFYRIIPKENAGYNPTIFLGDLTGNKVNDILISIDSGGSGGYAFYYIYSFTNNSPKKIFDYEKFNQKCNI